MSALRSCQHRADFVIAQTSSKMLAWALKALGSSRLPPDARQDEISVLSTLVVQPC